MACAALASAGVPAEARAAAEVLGEVLRPTPVSAYAGHVAWSAWDPRISAYRLVLSVDGLPPDPVAVPPRRAPFDVDLGPGPAGGVYAVYSHCAVEPRLERPGNVLPAWNTGSGCDLHRTHLMTGETHRLDRVSTRSGSEYLPTIWGEHIAFARRYEGRRGQRAVVPHLYAASTLSSRASRRLPAGRRGTGATTLTTGAPTGMDRRDHRIAHTWTRQGAKGPRSTLRSVTRGGRSQTLATVAAAPGIGELLPPVQETARTVVSGRTRLGGPQLLRRDRLGAGSTRREVAPSRLVLALARDHARRGDRGTYVLDAPAADRALGAAGQCQGPTGTGRCRIVRLDGDPFAQTGPATVPEDGAAPPPAAAPGLLEGLLEGVLELPPVPDVLPPLELPPLPVGALPAPTG